MGVANTYSYILWMCCTGTPKYTTVCSFSYFH